MVHCCQGQFWSNIPAMSDPTFHQFKLRLPVELFQRLEAEAARANRSVSAEMIYRLETSLRQDNDAPIGWGLDDPQDRDAVLKSLLFKEIGLLRRRVEELGGREAVLQMDKAELAKRVTGPRLSGTDQEKRSHMSRALESYPLTTLLTDDELGKLAERVITMQKAMGQAK